MYFAVTNYMKLQQGISVDSSVDELPWQQFRARESPHVR